jgi:hypothetical protein
MKKLAVKLIGVFLLASCTGMPSSFHLKGESHILALKEEALERYPRKPSVISCEQIDHLLALPSEQLVLLLQEVFQHSRCHEDQKIPSDAAIILAAVFDDDSFRERIWSIRNCQETILPTELPVCEYYCSFDFADKVYALRLGKKPISFYPYEKPIYADPSLELIAVRDTDGREELALQDILKQNSIFLNENEQSQKHFNHALWLITVEALGEMGRTDETLKLLLKECLWLYGRDATGEDVFLVQNSILKVLSRVKRWKYYVLQIR